MGTPPPVDANSRDQVDSSIQRGTIVRDLLLVAAVGAGIWILHRLGRIVIILILSMFLAYMIAPLVDAVQRPFHFKGRSHRLPRAAAIAIVFALLAGAAGITAMILWPSAARQLNDAIVNGPMYTESFHNWEHGWTRYYERMRIPIELRHSIDQSVLGAGDAMAAYARGSLLALIGMLSDLPFLALIPALAFLLLKDAQMFRRTLLVALPHHIQLRTHRLFEELNATLAAYIRAQLIACVIVGSVCGIGFALLGNPYAILLGALAAVLEFIPLIGPLIVAVVTVAVAAVHDPLTAVWSAVFLMVVRVIEDYVVYPRLIGRGIHLHSVVVILAVLAGVELGGLAGIFIAVPVVAMATVVARHYLDWANRDLVPALRPSCEVEAPGPQSAP